MDYLNIGIQIEKKIFQGPLIFLFLIVFQDDHWAHTLSLFGIKIAKPDTSTLSAHTTVLTYDKVQEKSTLGSSIPSETAPTVKFLDEEKTHHVYE